MTDFSIPLPVVLLGVITGLTYGLLALGLVLVYRSNRIINFAHGDTGAFAAAVLGVVILRYHVPYWLIFPASLALGALAGVLVEIVAVRRLRKAPPAMSIIATLASSTFLLFLSAAINTESRNAATFPQPPGLPSFSVGALLLTPAYVAQLVFTPLIVVAVAVFLRYSKYGIAIRASADNRDTAATSGISPSLMSSLAWGIAGMISAYTAILLFPSQGYVGAGQSLGPGLLVRALFAAVVGRLSNLPVAVAAGVGVGVVEQVLLWNSPTGGGLVDAVLFVATLIALFSIVRRRGREDEQGSWLAVSALRPTPEALAKLWPVRNLGRIGAALLFVGLGVVGLTTNSASFTFTVITGYTLVGLSVYITMGLTGQLSLGQFAFAGLGGLFSYHLTRNGVDFIAAFLLAALLAAVASMVVGLPALRLKGLLLTVSTLAFALMCQSWLFNQTWGFGEGVDPGRPIYGGYAFTTLKPYYLFILPFLAIGFWLTRNIARGGVGRSLVAIRDNEDGARAFSLRVTRLKLQAFAFSGFLAGLGGAVYAHALPRLDAGSFLAQGSITVVAMTIIGGVSLLGGAFVGALYLIALPAFVPLDSAGLAASTLGWLILILYFPGGIAQVLQPLRDRLVDFFGRRAGLDTKSLRAAIEADDAQEQLLDQVPLQAQQAPKASRHVDGDTVLEIQDVAKHFGGITAVDGVSFEVRRGEIFGVMGPNGAGKTTLFEIISGFTRPDRGTVMFDQEDFSHLSPEGRAERGLVRSFQDARLFPTMTVLDAVRLSFERRDRTRFVASLFGLPQSRRAEHKRDESAREIINAMGLDTFRDKRVAELSTGTRRITELACLMAMEPRLLLLDEPSSGIAQRETEVLGELIVQLRAHLDATLLVIEHDIPLLSGISDRILAMDLGKQVTLGRSRDVCKHPAVIESYLGASALAVQRSGDTSKRTRLGDKAGKAQCAALTQSGSRCSRAATDGEYCIQHAKTERLELAGSRKRNRE